jgi:hypothetical protein
MTYRFEFDDTSRGDMRFRREHFALLQEALKVLLADLTEWNRRARAKGASKDPYAEEVSLLKDMTDWGDSQLAEPNALSITVQGMSVGSLRHDKAALEYAALRVEHEAVEKAKGMPSAVGEALGEKAHRFRAEAAKIDVSPAGILEELRQHLNELLEGKK